MTPLERAEQSKLLLDNPAFRAAMAELRQDLVVSLEQIPAEQHEAQHEAVLMLKTIVRLTAKLHGFAAELAVDQHKQREAQWYAKARETVTDLLHPRRGR